MTSGPMPSPGRRRSLYVAMGKIRRGERKRGAIASLCPTGWQAGGAEKPVTSAIAQSHPLPLEGEGDSPQASGVGVDACLLWARPALQRSAAASRPPPLTPPLKGEGDRLRLWPKRKRRAEARRFLCKPLLVSVHHHRGERPDVGLQHHEARRPGRRARSSGRRRSAGSSPSWPNQLVAVEATTMDWASIILPITPPELFAAAIRIGDQAQAAPR